MKSKRGADLKSCRQKGEKTLWCYSFYQEKCVKRCVNLCFHIMISDSNHLGFWWSNQARTQIWEFEMRLYKRKIREREKKPMSCFTSFGCVSLLWIVNTYTKLCFGNLVLCGWTLKKVWGSNMFFLFFLSKFVYFLFSKVFII